MRYFNFGGNFLPWNGMDMELMFGPWNGIALFFMEWNGSGIKISKFCAMEWNGI